MLFIPPNLATDRGLRLFRLGQAERVVAVACFRGLAQRLFRRLGRLGGADHGGLLRIRSFAADDNLMFRRVGRPVFRLGVRRYACRGEPGQHDPGQERHREQRGNGWLPGNATNDTGNRSKKKDRNATPTRHGRDVDNMRFSWNAGERGGEPEAPERQKAAANNEKQWPES